MSCRFAAALVLLLLCALPAPAQFRTVTVQNAGNNPVPTTIQNTPSVNVANTPTVSVSGTVNAAIAGTPNVNATITGTPAVTATITGTPAVSVTNLPTGTAGPASTTVLATRDLDNPALQPFQAQMRCQAVNVQTCQASLTVPPGKQLVIEYVNIFSLDYNPGGNPVVDYSLSTIAGGGPALPYPFAPGIQITSTTAIGEHQVRIYADAGSTVVFSGFSAVAGNGTVIYIASLSGHLVNAP